MYLLTPRIQLDARVGFGLNNEADDLFAGVGLSVLFPVIWLVATLVRGPLVQDRFGKDYYPYPFLDPATAGWGSVIAYIVALSLVLLGLAALAIVSSRRVGREAIRRQS